MDISEIIGFFITLFVIFFLVLRPLWEAMAQKKNPEEYEKKRRRREEKLRKSQQILNGELSIEEVRRQHVSKKKSERKTEQQPSQGYEGPPDVQRQFTSQDVARSYKSKGRTGSVLKSAYDITRNHQPSRGRELIDSLPNKQEIVVLHEIIGPPKSLK